jgi:hypothetical protein
VPGASYREGDKALFERIQDALRGANLTPAQAGLLRAQLDQPLLGNAPHLQRIKRLTDALPSLALLDAMIDNLEPGLRKAEGMLTCVLDAFASLQPRS